MEEAQYWIDKLSLNNHPEGGYYAEKYRSELNLKSDCLPGQFNAARSLITSIYFLLDQPNYSGFHRIKSDELWFFHAGDTLAIHIIHPNGQYELKYLGEDFKANSSLQQLVPAEAWFASEVVKGGSYSLVSCVVAPGFDFEDFELADQNLVKEFPQHKHIIEPLLVNQHKKA